MNVPDNSLPIFYDASEKIRIDWGLDLHAKDADYYYTNFKALSKALIDSANEIKTGHRSRNIPNIVKNLQQPLSDNSYPSKAQKALLLVAFASMDTFSEFKKKIIEKLLTNRFIMSYTSLKSEVFDVDELSYTYLSSELKNFKIDQNTPVHMYEKKFGLHEFKGTPSEKQQHDTMFKTSLMASLILMYDLVKCKVIETIYDGKNIDSIAINNICTDSKLSPIPLDISLLNKSLLTLFCAWKYDMVQYTSLKMPKDILKKITSLVYQAYSPLLIEKIMGAVKTKNHEAN